MKIRKIAAITVAAAAVAAYSVSAFAYDLNKDLGIGWSANITITGEDFEAEFGDASESTVFTLKYEADASLADIDGQNYWCVKTMLNDTGWPFIDTFIGAELSENKDTYVTPVDATEIKFTIPEEDLEMLKVAGLAFMGHGIKLISLTASDSETLPAPEAAPAETAPAEAAPAETTPAPASGDTQAATSNPKTGTGLAVGAAAAALVAAVASRKRK